jgi:HD-GYP domain-containing protein (c-di-GMP phosphodiesterase class II)
VKVDQLDPVLSDLLDRLGRHPTRFTQLALLCPRREDYLPDHAYTVAVLAMAIAHQLHWPDDEIRQLGQAGLLFDLGMLLVPERIRTGACQLTDVDRARVRRHPIFTLTMLEVVGDTPIMVRLAALQHQERENGSGYPQGKRREGICDLARVLAVADSFAAATEPRHYRRPKLPYIAMEETLRAASLLVLWKPAVRALVQAAGLFPVGSYLKLSDGRNASVIAANAKQVDRPTVQPLHGDGRPKGDAIDLAAVPADEVAIVRPLATATG